MSDTSITIAMFGLIGALVGAVPGILGVFFSWLRNRDSVQRSLKKVELAQAEVAFIVSWLELAAKLDDADDLKLRQQSARVRLDQLMGSVGADIERVEVEAQRQTVRPQSSLGFYIYSGFFFALLLGTAVDDDDDFSARYFIDAIAGEDGFILLLFALPWAYLLVKHLKSKRAR